MLSAKTFLSNIFLHPAQNTDNAQQKRASPRHKLMEETAY
jgi:hypothetical protein